MRMFQKFQLHSWKCEEVRLRHFQLGTFWRHTVSVLPLQPEHRYDELWMRIGVNGTSWLASMEHLNQITRERSLCSDRPWSFFSSDVRGFHWSVLETITTECENQFLGTSNCWNWHWQSSIVQIRSITFSQQKFNTNHSFDPWHSLKSGNEYKYIHHQAILSILTVPCY